MESTPSKTNQVTDALARDIRSGMFRPGEKLPSMRTLGKRFHVSTMVLHQAAERLEKMGLLKRSSRSGLYIPEKTYQRELSGFITGVVMGSMENYYEAFLKESAAAGNVVMTSGTHPDDIACMLEKKPLRLYVDLGCKDIMYGELRRIVSGYNTVYCNRFEWAHETPESGVLSDWISITEDTLRHFLDAGHRKIVFISHDPEILEFKRLEMIEAGRRAGLEFGSPEFQYCCYTDFTDNPERVLRIFRHDPPTAAFSRGDSPMYHFTHQLEMFLPECRGMEKIGSFDSFWSRIPGHEFSSWHWDWNEFWKKAFSHQGNGIEYYKPELNLRRKEECGT